MTNKEETINAIDKLNDLIHSAFSSDLIDTHDYLDLLETCDGLRTFVDEVND